MSLSQRIAKAQREEARSQASAALRKAEAELRRYPTSERIAMLRADIAR